MSTVWYVCTWQYGVINTALGWVPVNIQQTGRYIFGFVVS